MEYVTVQSVQKRACIAIVIPHLCTLSMTSEVSQSWPAGKKTLFLLDGDYFLKNGCCLLAFLGLNVTWISRPFERS